VEDRHPIGVVMFLLCRWASLPSRERLEPLPWAPEGDARRLPPDACLEQAIGRIEGIPLRKAWVRHPADWPWSSARPDYQDLLDRRAPGMVFTSRR
jgi:hypothetical protein